MPNCGGAGRRWSYILAKSDPPGAAEVSDIQNIVIAAVREVGPHLRVERKWGHDWFAGTDLICGIFAFKRHVDIEFWRGTTLPDPSGLLEGTGKNMRNVKVHTVVDARAPALRALLRAAIALDEAEPKRTR
jgi:hypothetical protein